MAAIAILFEKFNISVDKLKINLIQSSRKDANKVMNYSKSIELTPEEEKLFLTYQDKWRNIALSIARIDRDKAAAAIKAAYNLINEKEPEVYFCDGLYDASIKLDDGCSELDYDDLLPRIFETFRNEPSKLFLKDCNGFDLQLWTQIEKMRELIDLDLSTKLEENEGMFFECSFEPGHWQTDSFCSRCAFWDFNVTEFNKGIEFKAWNIFKEVLINCGLIAAYQEVCVICDRPTKLFFDEQNLLHAEGKPAVEYADGYKLYAYHGVAIPEKYGTVKLGEWKSEWLLTEENIYLKQILLEVIGINEHNIKSK